MTGIGGITEGPVSHAFVNFDMLGACPHGDKTTEMISGTEAIVLPRITTTLPAYDADFDFKGKHLPGLHLADPQFGVPGPVDVLLGADVFEEVIRHDRRRGFHGSPAAIETCFGRILTGNILLQGRAPDQIRVCVSTHTTDKLLQKFWEVESFNTLEAVLSSKEKTVVQHFRDNYYRKKNGRYVVLLP